MAVPDDSPVSALIIMPDSPEVATYRTDIKGWVSRDGQFYGDGPSGERAARYAGSTHNKCQRCGGIAAKSWLFCDPCRVVIDHERWLKLELVEWDGMTPLTLHRGDEYFFDVGAVHDYADANEIKVSKLDLVICLPNLAREVDPDYWSDALTEDGELPDWLEKALEQFNRVIRINRDEPLSWSAGKQRVILADAA